MPKKFDWNEIFTPLQRAALHAHPSEMTPESFLLNFYTEELKLAQERGDHFVQVSIGNFPVFLEALARPSQQS